MIKYLMNYEVWLDLILLAFFTFVLLAYLFKMVEK